jgi:hypothetical protein
MTKYIENSGEPLIESFQRKYAYKPLETFRNISAIHLRK